MFRYRPRLCLVQLATPSVAFLLDPFEVENLKPLDAILSGNKVQKIIHDVSFDVRLLATRKLRLGHVVDTSILARFLDEPATGLAALLERHLQVEVSKALQHENWGRRPIPEQWESYLVGDVQHLFGLADMLVNLAAEKEILEEVDTECLYTLGQASKDVDWNQPDSTPWTRVKGYKSASDEVRARTRALALLRENMAQQQDVPPFRVFPNHLIARLSSTPPRSPNHMSRLLGKFRSNIDKASQHAMFETLKNPQVQEPARPPAPTEEERAAWHLQKKIEKALSRWRESKAKAKNLSIHVVLPGHCLRDMVSAGVSSLGELETIPGFGAARLSQYGTELLAVLESARADSSEQTSSPK